jgi:hypothetical protein
VAAGEATVRPLSFTTYTQLVKLQIIPRLGHVRLQALTAGHLNGSTAPSSRKDCQFRRADRRTPYSVARSKTRCAGAGWFEAPLLSPTALDPALARRGLDGKGARAPVG